MTTYVVTRKSDSVEVYRYNSDEPVEWVGFEFTTHDHIAQVDPALPEPPAPAPDPVRISKLAFRNRFTAAEKATLEIAALHNASLAPDAPSNLLAASLRASFADQRDAQFIDLNRPDTRGGVEVLEQYGLVAAGRAAVILDTPPTDSEVWNG